MGLAEEAIQDKLLEHHLARGDIDLPQTAGPIDRQLQTGHLAVFAPNTAPRWNQGVAHRLRRKGSLNWSCAQSSQEDDGRSQRVASGQVGPILRKAIVRPGV